MLSVNLIIGVSVGYVALLFLLAWYVDRRAEKGGGAWLRSPIVYTLSLSVYCTAWTFYGAVGSAARNGLEFATIYLGPTLVFVGWWWLVRKLVRIGRIHRITSIADMISSRYGKSGALAGIATTVAVIAATPYIALQLQSVTQSFQVMVGEVDSDGVSTAFWVATGMAVFTILFGTRTLDESERHYGVVAAIAAEAVVKLTALIAVGLFVVFGIAGGVGEAFAGTTPASLRLDDAFGSRWLSLLFLSAAAIICLPRQFHVTVVENSNERHLATASWMFPLYLFMMSIFVLPIAAVGLSIQADGNPDMFVLSLPLSAGQEELAVLAFIGGFSSATSMVIVSTIALSTMVSNHVVAPLTLRFLAKKGQERSGDMRGVLLRARRISIVLILGLGYLYFRQSGGSDALASIGLIAFCGVAQFLPALVLGVFWRSATRIGAIAGLSAGFFLWSYTLFLPSFGDSFMMSASVVADGPWGIGLLKPQALAFTTPGDPLVHALVWSLGVNTALLIGISLFARSSPLERLQATLFVDVFRSVPGQALGVVRRSAAVEDLFILAQRILGRDAARKLFAIAATAQGKSSGLPEPTPAFISRLERDLAGSVGAASAHAMVGQTAGGETISLKELMEIADETARLMETSQALELKSQEAEQSAAQLREANDRLRALDMQKDEFLSQVSHELRTPMTSIMSFAEIIQTTPDLDQTDRLRFAGVIHAESQRLTRLLDEIRDLAFLEEGKLEPQLSVLNAEEVLDNAAEIALAAADERPTLHWDKRAGPTPVLANTDRLGQVFINLISNAIKHNPSPDPWVRIASRQTRGWYEVSVEDNGPGVPPEHRKRIFEKFFRHSAAAGAGLGLPISLRIMEAFGGKLELSSSPQGTTRFVARLPISEAADESGIAAK